MRHEVKIAARAAMVVMLAFYHSPLHAQEGVKVPVSVLERYVGEWVYPAGNSVKVVLRDNALFREAGGQLIPLVALSETRFTAGPVFTAEFVTDKAGGITQILTDGVGTEFRLTRKGSPPARIPSTPVATAKVPRSVLQRYVGVYEYLPGQMSRTDLKVVVRLKGDTLMRDIGWSHEDVLTPLSETRFRVGDTSLVTEFVIDSAGGITQVMGVGSQQMKARLKPKS
jgi:hypothetical protein